MLRVLHGDALSKLAELESESVQTCVTSPPYWGLRSYGTEPLVWDNHNGCQHEMSEKQSSNRHWDYDAPEGIILSSGGTCKCGAWRGELGLEPTPEMYVQHLVQILRDVRRSLRSDGTCWLNLGDSYGTGTTAACVQGSRGLGANTQEAQDAVPRCGGMAKQLIGIPWRVAFALQSDGWYLRSDIIWSKPNPMPESVTDRPTKSHEYIFLLAKSQKYYFDAEAVRERNSINPKWNYGSEEYRVDVNSVRHESGAQYVKGSKGWSGFASAGPNGAGRNIRSVWTVTTQPFSGAHFATFPPDLIKPCILAGAPIGGVVLDPFAGSGTTGKVAIELGRKAILIEPKAEYVEMIEKRCRTTIGLPFVEATA